MQITGLVNKVTCAGSKRAEDQIWIARSDGQNGSLDGLANTLNRRVGLLMFGRQDDQRKIRAVGHFSGGLDGDNVSERAVIARALERLPPTSRFAWTIAY
jgi:hypothetical protein